MISSSLQASKELRRIRQLGGNKRLYTQRVRVLEKGAQIKGGRENPTGHIR